MAPIRRLSEWSAEDLGMRSQGVSSVGFKNKNVKQRTWRSNHPQAFVGSVREGQGFAFRRKLKIQQNYKKLLWKEKKAQTSQESQFTDRYPEHLKHLYLAEEKRLRKQLRKVEQPLSEEEADQPLGKEQCGINQALSEYCSFEQPQSAEQCNIRMKYVLSSFQIKELQKSQWIMEKYFQVKAEKKALKKEFEKRRREREEAQRLYKKKKMEAFKILSKKTKKGQPNFNLQMEYLLKKIQGKN
uniref:Coiled-coil domain containing 59 n=1 Tax=Mustela putorius furo TaxID=9669 RepID=M3YIW2_MUSPF